MLGRAFFWNKGDLSTVKNVSKEFREKIYKGAMLYQTAKIVFADGRVKTLGKKDFYLTGNSFSDGPGTNAFPLGEAMSKHITMVLVNDDDRFSDYDFYLAKIMVWLKCDLSATTESILIGTFTVTTPESYGTQVTVEALDDMYKGNEAYSTMISYPATLETILRDSCSTCGVHLLTSSFSNKSFVVKEMPEDITHRQLWGMVAMLAGGNARMDENNYLEIVEYDFSYFEKSQLHGGYFDTGTPYTSGDDAFGGDFTDWSSGDSFDGGNFTELNDFHMFYRAKIPTLATDDVVITGIQATVDEEIYIFGSEGYVLNIKNQLIENNPSSAVELIGSKLVGLRFRPFTLDHMAYPLAEFGDLCYVADRKGNVYQSVVTDVSFNYFGYTTISCAADDPLRNSSKYYSDSTEAIVKARKNAEKQLSKYNLAVQQLTNLIMNSFGVFKTEEVLEDGSTIYYLHDKVELSSSKKIWKMTADAFAVSSDGGKTWNAGLDSEGNAVVNVLSAIGVNADWVIAGLLSDTTGLNWWNLDTGEFHLEKYPTDDDVAVLFAVSENEIMTSVGKLYETKDDAGKSYNVLQSSMTQNAESITAEVKRAKAAENELSSKIIQTAESITAEVKRAEGAEESLSSSIVQAAESIKTKVEKGGVVSEINQSAEEILLKGNRVLIEADNCNLQKDGTMTLKNGKFSGEISGSVISLNQGEIKNILAVYLDSLLGGFTTIQGRGVISFPLSEGYASQMSPEGFYISEYTGNAPEGTWNLRTDSYYGRNMSISGTKSRNVGTNTYGRRNLYCYEIPSPMFGDLGEGQIDETGQCYIFIDDIFSETIDTDCAYQVFLQSYGKGECYVTERTSSYFVVEGTEGLSFAWEIKAVQKDYDTMRLEEYEEPEVEEDTAAETEAYLNSLVDADGVVDETEGYLETLAYQEESEVQE